MQRRIHVETEPPHKSHLNCGPCMIPRIFVSRNSLFQVLNEGPVTDITLIDVTAISQNKQNNYSYKSRLRRIN